MARNSKGRSGQKKKTSTSSKPKSSKTLTQKHVECQEDEKDDTWSNDEEEELVTPKSALVHAQTHEDIRPIVLDETVTMQEGMNEYNNADKKDDDLVHITMDDIQPEVDYWKPSIVSFVIGANPPGKIMEGFFRRVWREHGVDKVITIKRDVTQDEIKRIPIWVHMELNFKYLGAKCLEKIVKPVGMLIKVDNVTAQREKLHYARCMIEVDINQKFPMAVQSLNEKNEITNVPITYEWKPEICSKYKRMGHASQQCVVTNNQPKMQQNGIVLTWNPNSFAVAIQYMSDQLMHYVVQPRSGLPEFFSSFIYSHNDAKARDLLWKDLDSLNNKLTGPWMIMGDFNCILNVDEKIGTAVRAGEMEAAKCYMEACGMQDIPYSGHYYTWSNKQMASERVFTKLDRVMANDQWLEMYKGMNAIFLAEGCSDHSPALLRMNQGEGSGKKPFKYYRMWQQASDYKVRVEAAWESTIQGTAMFNLVQKLKRVKETLKALNKIGFCSVQAAERSAYQQLVATQVAIQSDPHNAQSIEQEKMLIKNTGRGIKLTCNSFDKKKRLIG
ncbi:Isopentenyl-diphosphate delta-isomerase [Bienertia sinuspersici]